MEDLTMKRNITAVYIRGCAFKATAGGRRHHILNKLKDLDENPTKRWPVAVAAGLVGACFGSVVVYLRLTGL